MKIHSNPRDFDIEGDCGRSWGLDVSPNGGLRLTMSGLREDSAAAFTEDQYAPLLEIDVSPGEDTADAIAALQAWIEQLASG